VSVDGRDGSIVMDLRPNHDFVKVVWRDDLSSSDGKLVAVGSVKLVRQKCSKDDFVKW